MALRVEVHFIYESDFVNKRKGFNTLFNEVLDKHAPIRKGNIRGRPSPYITDEIRELMKARDRWRKIARRKSNPDAWVTYKNVRNDVNREIGSAERAFAADQIMSNPNNSSQLWKTIRSFIPKKSASLRSFSKDDKTVANDFNRFFTSVGQVAVDKIIPLLMNAILTFRHLPLIQEFFRRPINLILSQQISPPGLTKFRYLLLMIAFLLSFR